MFHPSPLQPGNTLIAIAPSGRLRAKEGEKFEQGLEIWRNKGYKIELEPNYLAEAGYLAGSDKIRRQALQEAWTNLEYKAILCVRGGYGGARLLENWQWQNISSPKWLIGFSDITSLLWSLYQQGIVGLHAPVLTTIAQEPEWSLNRLFDYLEGKPLGELTGKGWGGGKVTGKLLPANLTVATHLLGTPICPNFEDVILALEDVKEPPYRLDRMLTQWRLMGIFQQIKGLALGRFSGCDAPTGIPSWNIKQMLRERLQDLNIPIVSELPFGHDGVNACLPVGNNVELDGDKGVLLFR
jgi:muramoyltetrapeptide carboxypeptidase